MNNILLHKFAKRLSLDFYHIDKNNSQFEDHQSQRKSLLPD